MMDSLLIICILTLCKFLSSAPMDSPLCMCTYNVHGFNDTKVEYIQQLIDKYDFVLLQEHWLLDSECHVFQDKLSGVVAHCISGMDETSLKAGRGYGGCAILWKSSQVCTIEPVELDNKRVLLLKLNCKMPVFFYAAFICHVM